MNTGHPHGKSEDFILRDHTPTYLQLLREGALDARVQAAWRELANCRGCPRECEVDRLRDEVGVCRTGRRAMNYREK